MIKGTLIMALDSSCLRGLVGSVEFSMVKEKCFGKGEEAGSTSEIYTLFDTSHQFFGIIFYYTMK